MPSTYLSESPLGMVLFFKAYRRSASLIFHVSYFKFWYFYNLSMDLNLKCLILFSVVEMSSGFKHKILRKLFKKALPVPETIESSKTDHASSRTGEIIYRLSNLIAFVFILQQQAINWNVPIMNSLVQTPTCKTRPESWKRQSQNT